MRALLGPQGAAQAAAVAAVIDAEMIRRIDAFDNGVEHPSDTLGLVSLIEDCNLAWDRQPVADQAAEDAAFIAAAALAATVLARRVGAVRARLAAEAVVLAAYRRSAGSAHPRAGLQAAVAGRGLRARSARAVRDLPGAGQRLEHRCHDHRTRLLYAASPSSGCLGWPRGMPPSPRPPAFPDAIFVHPRLFIGVAGSRAGVLAMAATAIACRDHVMGGPSDSPA